MTILREQLSFIRSPDSFLQELTIDSRGLLTGFRNVIAIAVLYEMAILLWAFGSNGVTLPPFLKIPEKNYYFYELIFLIPMFIVT